MISLIRRTLRAFRRNEDGSASVEFVLVFPIYLGLMIMSLELSMITLRHVMLERGLDIAVRDIRLGTGTAPTHDAIKDRICEEALVINECSTNLRLEMVPSDMRNLTTLGGEVMCTEREEQGEPVLSFTPGQQNQLMFLRACLQYDPIFPAWELGSRLQSSASGQLSIVSMSAFVQEPL
ncbi:pilus assembly protein [Pseudohalocynthiibacter aestuariivivens]|uniref:Pilus assembly protein n=1 Tax=Roseovarius pelagicus TaxID=2980108 RepID=A0ABY6DGJ0_9RHOB|nr:MULTISPECIES: TadE/TadG family type IV pilus assembly protein [Rhodobacterales]QIE45168.1 pilus assembly protein [Pseudohalocynthiibacter aestuariivivens]UXX82895.1 pilus assembly protein [Roseovarius pelagicus]